MPEPSPPQPTNVRLPSFPIPAPFYDVLYCGPAQQPKGIVESFRPVELGPKDWGTELLVAHTEAYTGKVLYMNAGGTGPLQHHEYKDETFFLFSGKVLVEFHDGANLRQTVMEPGESYHVPPGAIHRVEALQDSVLFEASTPAFDDRVPYTTD